jgi:hypothetical protein
VEQIDQSAQVRVHDRREIRVDRRRAHPLVLADLGQQFVRRRHQNPGQRLAGQGGQCDLVRGIDVGVDQADGQRVEALVGQAGQHSLGLGLVQLSADRPVGVDALVDLDPEPPRHQGRRPPPGEVVHRRARFAPDVQLVTESARGHDRDATALALQQRVGRDRRAVEQRVEPGRATGRQHVADQPVDRGPQDLRRRENLVDQDRAVAVDGDHVGEGPADVEGDGSGAAGHRPDRSRSSSVAASSTAPVAASTTTP